MSSVKTVAGLLHSMPGNPAKASKRYLLRVYPEKYKINDDLNWLKELLKVAPEKFMYDNLSEKLYYIRIEKEIKKSTFKTLDEENTEFEIVLNSDEKHLNDILWEYLKNKK